MKMFPLEVIAPKAKILVRDGKVVLGSFFIHDEFVVHIKIGSKDYTFEIDLPEWLEALTYFLNADCTEYKTILLVSGEKFEVKKDNDTLSIRVFNKLSGKGEFLTLSDAETRYLHKMLRSSLETTVEQSAGQPVEIIGIDKFDIIES